MRWLLVGTLLVICTGCASVPLSTMWKMRDITLERFFEADPRALRVAIRSDDVVKRGDGVPQIRIDIEAKSVKPICYAFTLDPVDPWVAGEPSLESSGAHRRWYAFALSRKGVEAFYRAKREVRLKELEGGRFSLAVTFDDLLVPPADAKTMSLRVDIALDRKDGYMTLIKAFDIELDRKPSSSSRAADASAPKAAAAKPDCLPAA